MRHQISALAAMLILASLFAACGSLAAPIPAVAGLDDGSSLSRPEAYGPRPLRVGHRGASGLAPENTLAAFEAGLAYGAEAIEFDVRMCADGRFVVIHDPTVDRTTSGRGQVEAMGYAGLAALDSGARWRRPADAPEGLPADYAPQAAPSLEEALDFFASPRGAGAGLQVEIKFRKDGSRYPGIEAAVVEGLRARGLVERSVVISFDLTTLKATEALEPGLRTCALVGKEFFRALGASIPAGGNADEAAAQAIARSGADSAGVDRRYLTRGLYEALRRAGLGVGAWTVDDPTEMRALSALGVDFITTNRPDRLKAALP